MFETAALLIQCKSQCQFTPRLNSRPTSESKFSISKHKYTLLAFPKILTSKSPEKYISISLGFTLHFAGRKLERKNDFWVDFTYITFSQHTPKRTRERIVTLESREKRSLLFHFSFHLVSVLLCLSARILILL